MRWPWEPPHYDLPVSPLRARTSLPIISSTPWRFL